MCTSKLEGQDFLLRRDKGVERLRALIKKNQKKFN